eukprot:13099533-Ditylum_brightwellii.AAC.1
MQEKIEVKIFPAPAPPLDNTKCKLIGHGSFQIPILLMTTTSTATAFPTMFGWQGHAGEKMLALGVDVSFLSEAIVPSNKSKQFCADREVESPAPSGDVYGCFSLLLPFQSFEWR